MTKPAKGEISEEVKEKLQTEYNQVVTEVAEATSSMFWEHFHGQTWRITMNIFLSVSCSMNMSPYPASDQRDLVGALSFTNVLLYC